MKAQLRLAWPILGTRLGSRAFSSFRLRLQDRGSLSLGSSESAEDLRSSGILIGSGISVYIKWHGIDDREVF